jgi:hypothetical protein
LILGGSATGAAVGDVDDDGEAAEVVEFDDSVVLDNGVVSFKALGGFSDPETGGLCEESLLGGLIGG